MSPKRFWGRDMTTALRAVRESLGRDALIIETKSVAERNGGGIEITALCEREPAAKSPAAEIPLRPPTSNSEPIQEVREEIAALRSMLTWLAPKVQSNDVLKCLISHGVSPESMARISQAMSSIEGIDDREKIYKALSLLIQSGGQIPDEVHRLALIGPTGVGKTSAIIKLTVFEKQRIDRRIGWVNTDHGTLASGDPLALYASILGVRYESAQHAKGLERAFAHLADCDFILIDTPGVSPRDRQGMGELQQLVADIPNLHRMLLCSATTNHADMADWVKMYGRIGFNSFFFTKLDECRHFGPLINTAIGADYPLSYFSLGQNIAGDLEVARAEVLASLLLSGGDLND